MSGEPLTLAEAVPLGTVHLQRLLDGVGVRSLVIKGPAFVELGVRRPRTSNDIDLLIHPNDRDAMTAALVRSGWTSISHWFPPALDDLIYSTTFSHPLFPASVDVHHFFSGMFARTRAFEVMWRGRVRVVLANAEVETLCPEHALVLEALNKFKAAGAERWSEIAEAVVAATRPLNPEQVARAAEDLGAQHSAAALVVAMGGPVPSSPPSREFEEWARLCGRFRSRLYFWRILARAPGSVPRVFWQQVTLPEGLAKYWAQAHGVRYQSRRQVLWLRFRGLFRSAK